MTAQTTTEKTDVQVIGSVHASSKGSVHHTTNGSTKEIMSASYTTSSKYQRNVQIVSVLQEVVGKIIPSSKRELGTSRTEVLEKTNDIGIVLDFIAAERLKHYPHPGSNYDKILRWAEQFLAQVYDFSETVSEFVMYSSQGAHLVFGSCLILLQIGKSNLEMLDKLFGIFYKLSLSLECFAVHHDVLLGCPAAQRHCGNAYANLLQIIANATIFYSKKSTSGAAVARSGEFEELFGRFIESYYNEVSRASLELWSSSVEESIESIETIRNFLQPQDRVTRALLSDRISSRKQRAEYTCEWATKHLTDFARSKDDVLLITGREYLGKSVLAGWLVDRMRNTKGRLAHEVISFSIDVTLKEQTSSLALVKALVLQVFNRDIGNLSLYKAIVIAITKSAAGRSVIEVEDALWSALAVAVSNSRPVMFIIDGLDSLAESSGALLERIQKLSSSHTAVKTIVLSRPLTKIAPKNVKTLTIDPDQTKEDIAHLIRERLANNTMLRSMQQSQKDTIVEKIATSSQGSFAWADIVFEIIKTEKSFTSVSKSLDGMPTSLKDVISRLIAMVDITSKESKQVLAWMIASQRPLLLTEMKQLFEIDFSTMTYAERFTNAEQDIRNTCGGLVDITDGVVRFRALAIRQHLIEGAHSVEDFSNKDKKFPFHTKEANYDVCLRLLAYVKLVFDHHMAISMTSLTQKQTTDLFDEYTLLEYASRYWITHFKNSPMYEVDGQHKITSGLKNSFPTSTAHALTEITCLQHQYNLSEVYDLQQLALNLRRILCGEQTEVVLQTLINVANVRQHMTGVKEPNTFFYEAWKVSRSILSEQNEITVTCARNYIDSVTTFTTKSTELEESLHYFIEYQKTSYGLTDKRTIFYLRRLAEYCTLNKQQSTAATIYRQIYDVVVSQYGSFSTETEEIYNILRKISTKEELQSITQEKHKSIENNVSVTDARRTTTTRDMVLQYENENNVAKAEETMVNYWREISEASRTTKDVKVQEKQVDATFEYVEFLNRHKRVEEATAILSGLSLELERNTTVSQSRAAWTERIAAKMKQMGSMSAARSVYSSLWSYYRSSGQHNTKEAQSVAYALAETTSSAVTTVTTESQEEMLREILEISTITSTTVDISTVKPCWQLITLYNRQEKHEEIIEICQDMLRHIWPSVLTDQKGVRLPAQFATESVQIANQLAKSYFVQHYVDETSHIYYNIFQAFRAAPKNQTTELVAAARTLISHYQSIYRHVEALKVYEALYEVLVEVYDVSNHEAIDVAYEKAALELKHNRRKDAQASYERLYNNLKGDKEFCHQSGIRAALSLCKLYEKDQNWEHARAIYRVLWITFLRKGQEYSLGEEFVNQIFDRYLFILEHKTTTDYKTLRSLAAEYQAACIKLYGKDSERTLAASIRLAELDEKEESHKDEAISIYENVLATRQDSKITATSTLLIIANAKQRLAHLYSARGIYHDKAQKLYLEEYESSKKKHSPADPETLSWLNFLVVCYKRRDSPEGNRLASATLQDIATDIVLHEKDSNRLYDSSQVIARIYSSQKVTEPSGTDFIAELRRHVVSGESNITYLRGKKTGRHAYPFVVGFEESIRDLEGSGQFSVLMSELMTESLLTESYIKAKTANAAFDTVFGYGARLRLFLHSHNRKDSARLDEELLEIFTQKIVRNHQVDKLVIRQFFGIVVAQHGKDQQDVIILQVAAAAILRAFNENQFQRGMSLSILVDAYMHHYDGFRSQIKIETATKICLYLVGHETKKCTDAKLKQTMLHFSGTLLKEALRAAKDINLNLLALPIDDLNTLVGLLGSQQNYEDLEWLLTDLWNSRHALTWPQSTIVLLGRRLIECRFTMGLRSSAIELAEDMAYNLRRAWGPLDKTSLDSSSLLAELYTASGAHARAMAVHEEILSWIVSDEVDLDNVSGEEEAQIAAKHVDLLKHAYARNNGWPAEKEQAGYIELFKALDAQVGKEVAWANAVKQGSVQAVEKWVPMSKGFKEDGVGMWHGVDIASDGVGWCFNSETEKKRKHVNAMRRTSSRLSGTGWTNGANGTNGSSGRHSTTTELVSSS